MSMSNGQPPKSNAGTWAAVFGAVAVVGGVTAAALAGGKRPGLSGPRVPGRIRTVKKPCGCGR